MTELKKRKLTLDTIKEVRQFDVMESGNEAESEVRTTAVQQWLLNYQGRALLNEGGINSTDPS